MFQKLWLLDFSDQGRPNLDLASVYMNHKSLKNPQRKNPTRKLRVQFEPAETGMLIQELAKNRDRQYEKFDYLFKITKFSFIFFLIFFDFLIVFLLCILNLIL